MGKILTDGSNGDGPTEAVFYKHLRAMDELTKQKSALAAREKSAKKLAEDDGVPWQDLKNLNKIRASTAPEEAARMNRMRRWMTFLKHPLADLMAHIDEAKVADETNLTEEQREAKWKNHGFVDGRSGKSLSDAVEGHDPNSETGRWITQGWEEGQKKLAEGIKAGPAPKSSDTDTGKLNGGVQEPKRRGRPPKDKPATEEAPPAPTAEVKPEDVKTSSGKGLTYWHNVETRKVYEVSQADAPPEGAVNITREEFKKLSADYQNADAEDWESSAPPAPDEEDDGFDTPPAP